MEGAVSAPPRLAGPLRPRLGVRAALLYSGLAWCLIGALIAAPARASLLTPAAVRGQILLPEDAALPRGSAIEVRLEDVSRADAPAALLGTAEVIPVGRPPYPFTLRYDAAAIDPRMRYALRASVRADGRLLFTTTRHIPAFPVDGQPPELPLEAVTPVPGSISPLDPLPATYYGVRDCVGCRPGSETLELRPGGVYLLRSSTEAPGAAPGTLDDLGTWTLEDGARLLLRGGREAPMTLDLREPDRLVLRMPAGAPTPAPGAPPGAQDLVLDRQAMCAPLEPRLLLRGCFRYMADAARFTEALTGLDLPVALEADHQALEQAYLSALMEHGRAPGSPLAVSLDAWITQRPRMDAPGSEDTLVVERLVGVWPQEICPASGPWP